MYSRIVTSLALVLAIGSMTPALAGTHSSAYASGEVRKIDVEQSKLTLKHGPIDSLGMPAMTMVFRLKSTTLPAGLKVGDAVRFKAVSDDGTLTITEIVPGK